MNEVEHNAFIVSVLRLAAKHQIVDELFWFTSTAGPFFKGEDGPIRVAVNANDLFEWACSDSEDITPENLPLLEQAIADCDAAGQYGGMTWGTWLFACRVRGWPPQEPVFRKIPEALQPLFRAVPVADAKEG